MMHLAWMPLYILLGLLSLSVSYYLFFAFVYLFAPDRVAPRRAPRKRFLIVVPAHNEEQLIATTLRGAFTLNYPPELFQIAVIADNCNDRTAEIARECKVPVVLERLDQQRRGKGQALSWALSRLPLSDYDAVIIIDADTIIHREYLQEMNASLCNGNVVLQGYNNLLNPGDSSLTRLIHVTIVLKNLLFNEGKARLGLSVALMGTGMCFERTVLQEVGWDACSIGEDWEYFAQLTQRGIPVTFNARAMTYSQEATSLRQGFSQRLRWAGGKFETILKYGLPTFWESLWHRDFRKIDAVMSLLVPTFSQLAYLSILTFGLALIYPLNSTGQVVRSIAVGLLGLQILYFGIGLVVMRASAKTIFSVFLSPVFLCWKMVVDFLALAGYKRRIWHRTARNIETPKAEF